MHSPCRPGAVLAHRALYAGVRILGTGVLPGARGRWSDPVDTETWQRLLENWQTVFGAWDRAALYRRPQQGRHGFAMLLLRDGRAIGFVRVVPAVGRVEREFQVMHGVHAARPRTFRIARPLEHGCAGDWAWLATESVPNYPLGAVRRADVRQRTVAEVTDILDGVLTRTADVPDHWHGSHGDLAPWNLRTELGGAVRIIDWEDAGFAPPGVDSLYAALTARITFGSARPAAAEPEAVDWLIRLITGRRDPDEPPGSENTRLLAELRHFQPD